MRVLLTGGQGMLGRTLVREWSDWTVMATDLPEADITDAAGISGVIRAHAPDVVVHCAAMTAVDRCESETDLAYRLNAVGTANVASACHRLGIRLAAISTDYVFAGDASRPYHEYDVADGGRTVYGQSKLAGEEMVRRHCPDHLITRISWLYGYGGPSFVHTMVGLADGTRSELKVVADQVGNPTSTLAVARGLRELLLRRELVGTFHLTCEGEASWYDFAQAIFAGLGIRQKVVPCRTADYPRPAPRPANSRLEKRLLRLYGLPAMPEWQSALREFLVAERFPGRVVQGCSG